MSTIDTTGHGTPRGAWVQLFAETMCGHGCRVIARHGAVVGRTSTAITVQLFDWDVLDGRVPAPLPGQVLVLDPGDLVSLGVAVWRNYTEARPAELEAMVGGLGNCGHLAEPPTSTEVPYEPVRSERERDEWCNEVGILTPRELTKVVLEEAERRRRPAPGHRSTQ